MQNQWTQWDLPVWPAAISFETVSVVEIIVSTFLVVIASVLMVFFMRRYCGHMKISRILNKKDLAKVK
jgi:hypothetical protein